MSEREVFFEALDRDDPAKRAAFLDEACAGDAALRQRVEGLRPPIMLSEVWCPYCKRARVHGWSADDRANSA